MAKNAILDVLSSTIGRYVKNLDADALNVAVWSGKIELSNLSVNREAVNAELTRRAHEAPNLHVPFRVVDGEFESLKIEVPWARITSRPMVLRAKGLSIVVEPYDHLNAKQHDPGGGDESRRRDNVPSRNRKAVGTGRGAFIKGSDGGDAEAAIKKRRETRAQTLHFADEARKRGNAMRKIAGDMDEGGGQGRAAGVGASDPVGEERSTAGATFGARLVRRIAENLQLEIDSVTVSLRGFGCSAGVVLESLSLVTTDERGQRTFVDRTGSNDSFLYKSLLIKGLSVYCDEVGGAEDAEMERAVVAAVSARQIGRSARGSDLRAEREREHSYILSPLSFSARLRQSDLLRCVDFPKYLLTTELASITVSLSKSQLELGRRISAVVRPKDIARPLFPEYRPSLAICRATSREWWKYAVRCVGRLNRRRSWAEFFVAFQKRRRYIPLHKRNAHHDTCPWLAKLKINETAEIDRLEQDQTISAQGIMCWRNIADAQVEWEREKHRAAERERKRARVAAAVAAASSVTGVSVGKGGTPGMPPPRKSGWGSLFGARPVLEAEQVLLSPDENDDHYVPPIALTAEEMRELEEVGLNSASDAQSLSTDSMYCDVKFTLGSFRAELVSAKKKPLALLHMGTVAANFAANADGSFEFGFTLLSLRIDDRVTEKTLFPSVLRSLQRQRHESALKAASTGERRLAKDAVASPNRAPPTPSKHAFVFTLRKSKGGDQDLGLRMVAFEVVASSLLLREVKAFLAEEAPAASPSRAQGNNPMLAKSMSGSVDLFYDANLDGESELNLMPTLVEDIPEATSLGAGAGQSPQQAKVADRLSAALADAWGAKTEGRKSWTVECDVDAPILVLPEDCVDPAATVLVFDLGSFRFLFGKGGLSPQVKDWFASRPRREPGEVVIEPCSLEMTKLTFLVGRAGKKDWGSGSDGSESSSLGLGSALRSSQAIIEPVTLALTLGIESCPTDDNTSRTCICGVLPAISFQISPSLVSTVLSVYSKWISILDEVKGEGTHPSKQLPKTVPEESSFDGGIPILDEVSVASSVSSLTPATVKKDHVLSLADTVPLSSSPAKPFEYLHLSISLRRLSAVITTDNGDGLEAHLVSVVSSTTLFSNRSSSSRLCMGWFWILDNLEVPFPRNQRILCHSNLPRPSVTYAEAKSYTIMDDLREQGVFEDGYAGSSELADITLTKLPAREDAFTTDSPAEGSDETTSIDAKFTSLFLNWNPRVIKNLLIMKDKLLNFSSKELLSQRRDSAARSDPPATITAMSPSVRKRSEPAKRSTLTGAAMEKKTPSHIIINAKMKNFQIFLNSAKDDMPLFIMTMADTDVDFRMASNDDNMSIGFVVGDIRVETPATGRTLDIYRTILGLAPSQSTSLLKVKYGKGDRVIQTCTLEGFDPDQFSAFAEVELSPMRFVHVHSQVFTLIEYLTEGVLGALTAQVASSAAQAAKEITQSIDGDKLFHIQATGFDFILPAAAYSQDFLTLHAGNLLVRYISLANEAGSKARLSLSQVTMKCSRGMEMVHNPIQMNVGLVLNPIDAPTEDDRATRVDIDISQASFLISQVHYTQIMTTLARNIGEKDSFLRQEDEIDSMDPLGGKDVEDQALSTAGATGSNTEFVLSHGGVQLVEVEKRMYISVKIRELGLELCGENTADPIILISAVESQILLKLLPDEKKMYSEVTLHDLVCEDRRTKSFHQHFRKLVSQVHSTDVVAKRDVFSLRYTKFDVDGSMDIDLAVGSPQVVFITDGRCGVSWTKIFHAFLSAVF